MKATLLTFLLIALWTGAQAQAIHETKPVPQRGDYRFETSFLTDDEGYVSRIVVKGFTPQCDSPCMEFERDLVERLDEIPNADEAKGWIDDQTDINFDGIPDVMVFIGRNCVGRVAEYYSAFVWNDEDKCFNMVLDFDEISNPVVHPDSKTITSSLRTDAVEITTWTYAWVDGYLEIIDETTSTFGDE